MKKQQILKPVGISLMMFLALLSISLACSASMNPVTPTPNILSADTVATQIALGIKATSLARTVEALQNQLSATQPPVQPLSTVNPTIEMPTQAMPTSAPTATSAPTITSTPTLPLVTDVTFSADTFYCYQSPSTLTVTVKVTDMTKGMAIYYRLKDKVDGRATDWEKIDLRRATSTTRTATLIGGLSQNQNIHFPALMHESWLITQIIADDGSFRSDFYSEVTFFPCGQ